MRTLQATTANLVCPKGSGYNVQLRTLAGSLADRSTMLKCDGSLAFMSGSLATQDPSSTVWSPPLILFLPLVLMVAFTIGRAITGKKPAGFPFVIAGRVVTGLLKEKGLLSLIALGVGLDALGSHLLGPVRYNTTHFDIITHVLAGFVVREYIERIDSRHLPFIHKIRGVSPGGAQKYITPTTLALAFMVLFELLEGVQSMIPGPMGDGVAVIWGWEDQFKDMFISNPLGILISARKASIKQAALSVTHRTRVGG